MGKDMQNGKKVERFVRMRWYKPGMFPDGRLEPNLRDSLSPIIPRRSSKKLELSEIQCRIVTQKNNVAVKENYLDA